MRGDILLFRSGGSLRDRAVCAYTDGPYCHCEIDLGNATTIGAHSEDGISFRPHRFPDRIVIISLQEQTSAERIESGLEWVLRHEGEPFSWASVADLALPPRVSTLLLGRRSLYNCANLVARYLEIAGGLDLPYGKRPPMVISPNDIARAAGLLPAESNRAEGVRMLATLGALVAAAPVPRWPAASASQSGESLPDTETPAAM